MIKTRLLKLLSHSQKYVFRQILWQWLGLVFQIMIVYCTVRLISRVSDPVPYLLAILLGVILRILCDQEYTRASYRACEDVKRILRGKIYEKLLRLGRSYRESVSSAAVVQLAVEGTEQLETYFGKYLSQFFYSLLAPLTLFAVLINVSRKAALVLLIGVPLIPITIVLVMKIAKRLLGKYWKLYENLGDSFLENLHGLTEMKVYGADKEKAGEMDREAEHFRRVTMKVLIMQLNSTSVMDIIAYGGAGIGMGIVAAQCAEGTLLTYEALMIVLLSMEFFLPMRMLGSYFHIAMNGMAASDHIFALLDLPEDDLGQRRDLGYKVDLTFEDLRFSYDGERKILDGISGDIMAASLVSVVGESGCGKSTLAQILAGNYRDYEGSVRLNGVELRDIAPESLAQTVTLVRQRGYLFHGTVRDNLLMGDPEATDASLRQVLRRVDLLTLFDMEKGLDTVIAENGSNLSGGQRQRLALARALLHDTAIYVMDEVSANIDPVSEDLILGVIRELATSHTVILISHRLRAVRQSRRIYLLKNGRIAQEGNWEQLSREGIFGEMLEKQENLEKYQDRGISGARTQKISTGARVGSTGTGEGVYAPALSGGAIAPVRSGRRPGLIIMGKMLKLVGPLMPVMLMAIFLGCIGQGCVILIPTLAARAIGAEFAYGAGGTFGATGEAVRGLLPTLVILGVMRGLLHYGEQYCNHYIAFRLLALIRHKVFGALRKLAPAKLQGKDKGELISVLTSDIEQLEVFYAHTISPIAIALVISGVMVAVMWIIHPAAGILSLLAYLLVGVVLPLYCGKRNADAGLDYRNGLGALNSYVLESLYGLDETLQYGCGRERLEGLNARSGNLAKVKGRLNESEVLQRTLTNLGIWGSCALMLVLCLALRLQGQMSNGEMTLCVVMMMNSFGPVAALSALAGTLTHTLASGERVLRILEEEPVVEEVPGEGVDGRRFYYIGGEAREIGFAYTDRMVLKDFSLELPAGKVIGINGKSGCGKSTFLKLLMRFWDVQEGEIVYSGTDIRRIPTEDLRRLQAYMTQDTWVFQGTLADNIRIGKMDATAEEIRQAASKAALADWIESLPKKYDTPVGELGDTISGGERQRIGLARAFLHEGNMMLLDEPTSSLDILSEGMVLQALEREAAGKTVILVSHRKSTMGIADLVYQVEED